MSVGPLEIMVILVVALLVFGPQRLPEVGRQVGAAVRELRKMQDTVRGELDMVLHPEHGTRSAEAAIEPGDHFVLPTGDPVEPGATGSERSDAGGDPDGSSPPDVDRGFVGPPDSFT
jgi:TatA/E family protein of Tat protein translocase